MGDSIKLNSGFWNFNLNFWERNSYRYDDAKMFDTDILIVDTSTLNPEYYSMSTKEKNKIRNHWINALPLLHNVEYLMTTHQIDQDFFDAICQMKNLKGLYIKWGKVEITNNIKTLNKLEHLYFGSNPRLQSIEGFQHLTNLKHLEIENFKSVLDFSNLEKLNNLLTLKITGSVNSPAVPIKDLYFLKNLVNLEELVLGISLKNKDVTPLLNLKKIKFLFLPSSIEKLLIKEKQKIIKSK